MSSPCVLTAADIEAIERATLAAVAPQDVDEIPGWLLPFDAGTVGRAHSAVPLRHDASISAVDIASIIARYRAHGLRPSLRIAAVPALAHLNAALIEQGLKVTQPTLTCVACVADLLDATRSITPAEVSPSPSPAWSQVYLGEGFDPVDGASRVKALSRASGSLYAQSVDPHSNPAQVVAAGVGSYGHGWLGIHGMRTLPAQRGRGLAARVLAGLADTAVLRNLERVFLQVEEGNTFALALYQRAGFTTAWRYHYWR